MAIDGLLTNRKQKLNASAEAGAWNKDGRCFDENCNNVL